MDGQHPVWAWQRDRAPGWTGAGHHWKQRESRHATKPAERAADEDRRSSFGQGPGGTPDWLTDSATAKREDDRGKSGLDNPLDTKGHTRSGTGGGQKVLLRVCSGTSSGTAGLVAGHVPGHSARKKPTNPLGRVPDMAHASRYSPSGLPPGRPS